MKYTRLNFKIIKYCFLMVAAFISGSCTDYLEKAPDDMLTLDMVFSDKVRTEEWLAGLYSAVPSPSWDPYGFGMTGLGNLGDDMDPSNGLAQFGWDIVNNRNGAWDPSTRDMTGFWTDLPKRVRSALIFLENVRANPEQKVTEEDVENMKNEARFLIAYYYVLLTDIYGPVPFNIDKIYTGAETGEDMFTGQVPYDIIIDWIDKELLDLSKKLPASYVDTQKYGRATSIMCLAVRARKLLFAASPLVNGNPAYKGHVNYKGEELFNPTYDPQKWERATQACKDLIDAAHAAGHSLYYEYNDDGSIDPFNSYQYMMFRKFTDGNKEILFARPSVNNEYIDRHPTPRGAGGNGCYGVTQSLVDAFFMKNGMSPILEYKADGSPVVNVASGYTEKGFSAEPEFRNTKWIEAQGDQDKKGQVTMAGTYNMYCNREPRFYISVLYNGAWYRSENREVRFMYGEPDGGPTHDAPQAGYLQRKGVHPDHNCRNGIYPYRPGILYRLGEAYLNYAEALNESNPGHPDIIKFVNLIRERAGIPQYGNEAGQLPAPVSQEEMREAIHRERRVELNTENIIRYFDVRRWLEGEKCLNGSFYGMNFYGTVKSDDINDPNAYFKRTKLTERVFNKKHYWFPVPQTEIDKNPNLVQNPFW